MDLEDLDDPPERLYKELKKSTRLRSVRKLVWPASKGCLPTGSPLLADPVSLADPIGGGAAPAESPMDDADPAANEQAPIDLASDPSNSDEDHSDSDDSSAVAVEPVD